MVTVRLAAAAALALAATTASAFLAPVPPPSSSSLRPGSFALRESAAVSDSPSCECGSASIISGTPSKEARAINPKEALAKSTVYRLDGTSVSVSDLMASGDDGVSLIVLTRSFG